jgi:hypothetical protein
MLAESSRENAVVEKRGSLWRAWLRGGWRQLEQRRGAEQEGGGAEGSCEEQESKGNWVTAGNPCSDDELLAGPTSWADWRGSRSVTRCSRAKVVSGRWFVKLDLDGTRPHASVWLGRPGVGLWRWSMKSCTRPDRTSLGLGGGEPQRQPVSQPASQPAQGQGSEEAVVLLLLLLL